MRTFYDEIRTFLFLFQISGLSPFGRNEFQNYIMGLYSIFSFVALLGMFILAFFVNEIIDDTSLSSVVAGLVFMGELMTHLVVIVHSFVSRNDQLKALNEINEIDGIFQNKIHHPIDYPSLRKKYFIKFIIILVGSNGLMVFLLIFLSVGTRSSPFLFWFHMTFSISIVNMRCIQNIFFIDLLRERLELINDRLQELSKRNGSKTSKLILYVEAHKAKQPNSMHDEYLEVLALKQVYGLIWNACNLNECLGWSILAIVTRSFISFTSHGYWIFLGLEEIIVSDYIVDSSTLFLLTLFLLSMQCLSGYSCTGCAQDTAGWLNKIEKKDNNEPFNSLLREFSLQILHEPIVISANGFFDVNLDLLGSLAAATVTYLVILIQFQLSEKENKAIAGNSTATT